MGKRRILAIAVCLALTTVSVAVANKSGEHGLAQSKAEWQAQFKTLPKEGLRVRDLEITGGTTPLYHALWTPGEGNYAVYTKLTSSGFGSKWRSLRKQGYTLIDQESYRLGWSQYYAGV